MALPARGCGTDTCRIGGRTELQSCRLVEAFWKGAPQRVTAPYAKDEQPRVVIPSNAGTVKTGVNLRGPPRKAKYVQTTDSARVP
jgi:hypothetical protein